MFSLEFYNRSFIISSYKIRRIDFKYADKLRKLILQALKQPCDRVVLNLVGVRFIDPGANETMRFICDVSNSMNIELLVVNADTELCEQIRHTDFSKKLNITSLSEIKDLIEI